MEITVRDAFYAVGLVGGLVSLYVTLDRRVTRLEAVNERLESYDDRIKSLEAARTEDGAEKGEMRQMLKDIARRVLALEDAVAILPEKVVERLKELRLGA